MKDEAKHPLTASLELLNKSEEETQCNNKPNLVRCFSPISNFSQGTCSVLFSCRFLYDLQELL